MDFQNINGIDLALAIIILFSSVYGLWRGLIRGVFGIASLVLAFFVVKKYGSVLANALGTLLGQSVATTVIGYALTFVIALMIFSALTFFLYKIASKADLGTMDRYGGLLFGFLSGVVRTLIVVFVLSALPLQNHPVWRDSLILPIFGTTLRISINLLDKKYEKYFQFDKDNRPSLLLPDLENTANVLQQRDDLLDKILDDAEISNSQESSGRQAREKSSLQEFKDSLDGVSDGITKDAELRRREELRPKPLSEFEEPKPKSLTEKVKKFLNEGCEGDSCPEEQYDEPSPEKAEKFLNEECEGDSCAEEQ